jgi:hypothetical protein
MTHVRIAGDDDRFEAFEDTCAECGLPLEDCECGRPVRLRSRPAARCQGGGARGAAAVGDRPRAGDRARSAGAGGVSWLVRTPDRVHRSHRAAAEAAAIAAFDPDGQVAADALKAADDVEGRQARFGDDAEQARRTFQDDGHDQARLGRLVHEGVEDSAVQDRRTDVRDALRGDVQ